MSYSTNRTLFIETSKHRLKSKIIYRVNNTSKYFYHKAERELKKDIQKYLNTISIKDWIVLKVFGHLLNSYSVESSEDAIDIFKNASKRFLNEHETTDERCKKSFAKMRNNVDAVMKSKPIQVVI